MDTNKLPGVSQSNQIKLIGKNLVKSLTGLKPVTVFASLGILVVILIALSTSVKKTDKAGGYASYQSKAVPESNPCSINLTLNRPKSP